MNLESDRSNVKGESEGQERDYDYRDDDDNEHNALASVRSGDDFDDDTISKYSDTNYMMEKMDSINIEVCNFDSSNSVNNEQ